MRLAIITDIHGNLTALEAVLAEIGRTEAEEVWCLGDVVGYGAAPNECTATVERSCALKLVGNHDLAVTGEIDTDVFSAAAAAAVEWTRDVCSPPTMDLLRSWRPAETEREVAAYHASPRDPVWEYVLALDQALECLSEQESRIALIGHSHVALYFSADGGAAGTPVAGRAEDDQELDLSEGRWLLNPGSVGQPRDGDPRAAWLELDTGSWRARYHRVEYNIDHAADAIRAAGLPGLLADRLYEGH